jgi:hypothetical protein
VSYADTTGRRPALVLLPATAAEAATALRLANEKRVGIVLRGSGTSGPALRTDEDTVVLASTRLNHIVELDTANLTAAGQKYAENLNKATDELQKWKSKLDTVPKDKRTEVKAEIKKAQANVDRIKREIAGIKGKTVTLNVKATGGGTVRAVVNGKLTQFVVNASGGIWPARPGGYLSTIAEAGVDEAAIPLRKDSRSRALLAYASNAILGTPAGGNVFNISGSKLDAETIQQAVNRSLVASFGG